MQHIEGNVTYYVSLLHIALCFGSLLLTLYHLFKKNREQVAAWFGIFFVMLPYVAQFLTRNSKFLIGWAPLG